jgi:luciferase family oxidoreductase group 1
VEEGRSAREAFAAAVDTVRRADHLDFRRVWVAEHHGYRSVGSVAPAVLAAHLATVTERIRVGSGGVLLPNHAPLAVAEQFATLASLHPGRIDVGVGRGPGTTDQRAIRALRGTTDPMTDTDYRAALVELLGHLGGDDLRVLPGADAIAAPWLLSSSAAGAELAAELGLPLALAHHIRPSNTIEALTRYRDRFRPSRWRDQPYAIISVETLCAPTDAEAAELGRPSALAMAGALRGEGVDAALPTPDQARQQLLPPEVEDRLAMMRETQAHGSPESVAKSLNRLAVDTAADELMLLTPVYDPAARIRSLELVVAADRQAPRH